jgi:sodium/potassium/calcium exchanger 6
MAVTSIVVGSIALIRPFYVPKTAFIRDVLFFTAAVVVLVIVLHDGHLTLVESTAMVALYLLYVVVVIIMNVMAKEKRHTTSNYAKTPEENGWKSLPGSGGGFGAVSPATSRPTSLQLPSPKFGPVNRDRDREEDGMSAGSSTPTGPGPRPGPRRGSNPHSHFHLDFNNLRNTPDYPETPRANFSLLGAIEFRDVVNSLKREEASRTPSPGRSPHAVVERTDYFTAGHRRSVSHAPLRRSSANANSNPSSSGANRSRAISHVVQPGNMATFTMTPSEMSPTKRMKLNRAKTAPGLDHTIQAGEEEIEELLSPGASDNANQNPWRDQHGHPPSLQKPVLPKLSIPEPNPFKKGHGGTPSISIVDPSGHVEEPIYSPPPLTEPSTPYAKHAPVETRFRFRHRIRMILNVLFPSLQSFRHKSIIGMILSIFSVPAILVLTLTLPVVDDGDREGGIALPDSDQEPLTADLEPGQLVEQDYGDGLLRPDIGEGLHHLVDGGFSPLHSPLGRIHSSRRTPEEYEEEEEDDGERGQELMEALEREESFGFNKSLTAAQCVFGPTFCAYIIFGMSPSILLISRIYRGRADLRRNGIYVVYPLDLLDCRINSRYYSHVHGD